MRARISSLEMRTEVGRAVDEEVVVVVMDVVMEVVVVLRQGLSPLRGVRGLTRPSTASRLITPLAHGPSPAAVGRRPGLKRREGGGGQRAVGGEWGVGRSD